MWVRGMGKRDDPERYLLVFVVLELCAGVTDLASFERVSSPSSRVTSTSPSVKDTPSFPFSSLRSLAFLASVSTLLLRA